MTKLLEKAFQAAAKLSPAEQDALAQAILAEVAAESEWERRLKETPEALERLADEALKEHRARARISSGFGLARMPSTIASLLPSKPRQN